MPFFSLSLNICFLNNFFGISDFNIIGIIEAVGFLLFFFLCPRMC